MQQEKEVQKDPQESLTQSLALDQYQTFGTNQMQSEETSQSRKIRDADLAIEISVSNINIEVNQCDQESYLQEQSDSLQFEAPNSQKIATVKMYEDVQEDSYYEPNATAKKLVNPYADILDSDRIEPKESNRNLNSDREKEPHQVGDSESDQKSMKLISNPVLSRCLKIVRVIGCIIMLANFVTETTYLIRSKFATSLYFFCYIVFFVLKLLIPSIIIFVNFKRFVIGKYPRSYTNENDVEARQKIVLSYRIDGYKLHSAVPLMYWTGVYRMLNAKDFSKEIGIGFGLEILFTWSLFFLQGVNNSTLASTYSEKSLFASGSFQQISIILKLAAFVDIIFELIIFISEVYRYNELSKSSVNVVVRYNEEKKRKLYSRRYLILSTVSVLVAVILITILSVSMKVKGCKEKQGLLFNTVCSDCQIESCVNCAESGPYGCDQCAEGTFYNPIQKLCQDCNGSQNANSCLKCEQPTSFSLKVSPKCLSCKSGFYLGKNGTSNEGKCGNCQYQNCDICDSFDQCVRCISGFYLNKANGAICQPFISLDVNCDTCDTSMDKCLKCKTGFFIGTNGICKPCGQLCSECQNDQTCEKCQSEQSFLDTKRQCQCIQGYYLDSQKQTCQACTSIDLNCRNCDSNRKCTLCQPGSFLENGTCKPCIGLCSECSSAAQCTKCRSDGQFINSASQCQCKTGYYLNITQQACVNCTSIDINCRVCDNGKCTQCNPGFYAENGTCKQCVGLCSECTSATSCTSCRPGKTFLDTLKRCQCQAGYYQDNTQGLNSTCQICRGLCTECSSASNCTKCRPEGSFLDRKNQCQCQSGFYLFNTKQTCQSCSVFDTNCANCDLNRKCTQCNSGYFLENGQCKPCQKLCNDCTNAVSCNACKPLVSFMDQNKTCRCKAGLYLYSSNGKDFSCQACKGLCTECTSAQLCTKCNSVGAYLDSKGQCQCKEGYYFDSVKQICQSCMSTDINCRTCDSSKCTQCNSFSYLDNGRCKTCVGLCQECTSASNCTSCRSQNSFLDLKNQCQCASGFYADKTNRTCQSCSTIDNNCATCDESRKCTKCKSGLFLDSTGVCKLCLGPC